VANHADRSAVTLERFECIDGDVEALGVEGPESFIDKECIDETLATFEAREGECQR
jgi:hypothetical protein